MSTSSRPDLSLVATGAPAVTDPAAPEAAFADRLRGWRKSNRIKQEWLASQLGVTQAAVSRWESGADRPRPAHMSKLVDLIAETMAGPLDIEQRFTEAQPGIVSFLRYDGMRLLAVSRGYRHCWPKFTGLVGRDLMDHLVDEAAAITQLPDLRNSVRDGTLAYVTGVSERHTAIPLDAAIYHRWHACFRKQGPLVTLTMSYEPCSRAISRGIHNFVHLDTFAAE